MEINAPVVSTVFTRTGSFTLDERMAGAIIRADFTAAATITIPSGLPVGFAVTIIQTGAGQVTFAVASGLTLQNRLGHTKTAGQFAVCAIIVALTNPTLAGDTVA